MRKSNIIKAGSPSEQNGRGCCDLFKELVEESLLASLMLKSGESACLGLCFDQISDSLSDRRRQHYKRRPVISSQSLRAPSSLWTTSMSSEASIDPVIPLPQHAPRLHPLEDQEKEPQPGSKVRKTSDADGKGDATKEKKPSHERSQQ